MNKACGKFLAVQPEGTFALLLVIAAVSCVRFPERLTPPAAQSRLQKGFYGDVYDLSPDGQRAVTGGLGGAQIVGLHEGEEAELRLDVDNARAVAFDFTGNKVAVATDNGSVFVWDLVLNSNKQLTQSSGCNLALQWDVLDVVAVCMGDQGLAVQQWSGEDSTPPTVWSVIPADAFQRPAQVALDTITKRLAWRTLPGSNEDVLSVAFYGPGGVLNQINLSKFKSGGALLVTAEDFQQTDLLALNPNDSAEVALAGQAGIFTFDIVAAKVTRILHDGLTLGVAFTSDGELLVATSFLENSTHVMAWRLGGSQNPIFVSQPLATSATQPLRINGADQVLVAAQQLLRYDPRGNFR